MKSSLHSICQSSHRSLRKGLPILLVTATLLLAGGATKAHGWVAAGRGAGGRGFVAAGGGYRGGVAYRGYGYGGVRVGAVGAGGAFIHTIPPGYRMAYYGGYNCYYAGGVYYRATFYQGSTVYVVVP